MVCIADKYRRSIKVKMLRIGYIGFSAKIEQLEWRRPLLGDILYLSNYPANTLTLCENGQNRIITAAYNISEFKKPSNFFVLLYFAEILALEYVSFT